MAELAEEAANFPFLLARAIRALEPQEEGGGDSLGGSICLVLAGTKKMQKGLGEDDPTHKP